MTAFQRYQAEFTSHLRDPKTAPRPKGVAARRMKIYTEIVFNNMEGTLSTCFPVLRKIIGTRRWVRLVRDFMKQHRCTTPLFRQIPEEFLHWLEKSPQTTVALPPFLYSLAHYEWIELAVAVADVATEIADPSVDLLQNRPVLTPSLAVLEYPYPVHRISPRFKPSRPDAEPTRLLVFRDANYEVHFIELNAVTARLILLLQAHQISGRAALEKIATELHHPAPDSILQHGAKVLADLQRQGAILGGAAVKV